MSRIADVTCVPAWLSSCMRMRVLMWSWCVKHCYSNYTVRFSNILITDWTSRSVNTTCQDSDFQTIMSSELLLKIGSTTNTGASPTRISITSWTAGALIQPTM
ncbi:hypothetical protein TNCV_72961 [Trichonephila clavipes]|uniref:Uncharacterized protein n=1 Tax=Trichonephila clavipes TaxID=2585209 RepID=A0A8X6R730_TRICX|nr:hypothetical protein TNCV_72961 [Trichonephila clavipes]